ncbi:phosphoglycerate dehydrogenase [Candidatus Nitrosacidococcus tergens]|uniref:D-3-phosphoglycerate dehydrogenase n=1 Tax=Candidatus Nitrosacidococcus tergens TaxID=553981 RepID=A0A7G1Q9I3_9GAMM|nr:phosphoglycerate dehydrogenase [Candidatus Nitrosacidococcus tergens]CAB1275861.1 D-3-phosphoglycerate dehydrogenase [Candidatus Nitrosacidococcus tergens]
MYKIQVLNNISEKGLARLSEDQYEIVAESKHPDAILLRSHNMHDMTIPSTLKAVGRAGAGTNNIPVSKLSKQGIAVFNTPGANANAVKELVLAGLFLSARNICQAWQAASALTGTDDQIHLEVESQKKKFVGIELPGKTLGIVGLGAIGVEVANAALNLGMRVIGYDPQITVNRAWALSASVEQAESLEYLLSQVDFLSLHVPLVDSTKGFINEKSLAGIKKGARILNFARAEIVVEEAIVKAIKEGKIAAYICDFPGNHLKGHPQIITLPHLGASTHEAEENCAVMIAEQIRDFLQHGTVRNSVNFPDAMLPRTEGWRLAIINANVPNMVAQISTHIAHQGLNIVDMINRSKGNLAYTLIDIDQHIPGNLLNMLRNTSGIFSVRVL